ncbi:uncharacterized protein EV422DRAFT_570575 [Fimicolochytrium jonesii]|uniref:uncharacterized protein n=1 Tax=Fimicolochytrium jonesii TaxID=1396493 RepID=UPI0022FE8AD3|nr:uncharacterized protein EV422DRAFT_570575 [Fimicolochytrium jonesii]KAI8817528.1 hypothetical protein EV422DRAFT_570575 [Fimicolochytrium jonesii]
MPSTSVPPRPTIERPCTCIWQSLAQNRAREASKNTVNDTQTDGDHHPSILERAASKLPNPLHAIPHSLYPGAGSSNETEEVTRLTPETLELNDEASSGSALLPGAAENTARVTAATSSAQTNNAATQRVAQKAKHLKGKGLVGASHPDVVVRALKKRFTKSTENKLGTLFSYREDLVNTLYDLIPTSHAHKRHISHPPLIDPVPDTLLCQTCQTVLTYACYYSPAARTPYLRDHSAATYLALVDDATAALSCNTDIEPITHRHVNSALRAELSVVDWRIALKVARYHKRTGFMDMFPVRIGEFAELEVLKKPPSNDGIVKKTGKKLLQTVGLGGLSPPDLPQGTIATAAE